jgi:hypothetical protein
VVVAGSLGQLKIQQPVCSLRLVHFPSRHVDYHSSFYKLSLSFYLLQRNFGGTKAKQKQFLIKTNYL